MKISALFLVVLLVLLETSSYVEARHRRRMMGGGMMGGGMMGGGMMGGGMMGGGMMGGGMMGGGMMGGGMMGGGMMGGGMMGGRWNACRGVRCGRGRRCMRRGRRSICRRMSMIRPRFPLWAFYDSD